ncbi:hypothetical protein [Amycolatopsis sp. NPDC051372]|uniref:hypothetical protein n=1 Tax=Amycolatopsis sp. NPDC051372 TaxID=3155669 RepID=UPI00341DFD3A
MVAALRARADRIERGLEPWLPATRLELRYLPDVDGYLVKLDRLAKGVVDEEDLADHCPLWKQHDTADEMALHAQMALYAQIVPYLHEPRKQGR